METMAGFDTWTFFKDKNDISETAMTHEKELDFKE